MVKVNESAQKIVFSTLLFTAGTLLFTRFDYLIHHDLYNYGLQYSPNWFLINQILYFSLYQYMILLIWLYVKNWRVILMFEAFTLTAGQDLIFFTVWNNLQFPKEQWTWTPFYKIFGYWTTEMQIAFTLTAIMFAAFIAKNVRKRLVWKFEELLKEEKEAK